ncbi:MAG TPA: hypothetical protein VLD58_02865, partial [Gemmatimonadales bacterium]|nr:hypothetical protein [Gemmatimonadales bacterium]
ILMALLVKLPVRAVGIFGLAVIVLHNLFGGPLVGLAQAHGGDALGALLRILYVGFWAGPIRLGPQGPNLVVLYSIIPWIGVMAAGYAFARVLTLEAPHRNRLCLRIGLGAVLLFLVLRGFNLYGDPSPWSAAPGEPGAPRMPAPLAFLNTSKYPASLLFLLMTLGPTIALIPLLERAKGGVARLITVYGRVPFFYYMLHIPLIHALALLVSRARSGAIDPWLFTNHPMGNPPPPEGYPWGLPLLYLVWLVALAILYPICRWFAGVKARRDEWWLRYL